jgi:hypothetical protein
MSTARFWLFVCLTAVALTLVTTASVGAGAPLSRPAAATGGAPGPGPARGPLSATVTGALSSEISYQGYLTDATGNPLGGSHNLSFQLWDDPTGGTQQGPDISLTGVAVTAGVFSAALPVDPALFDGDALWLRLGVDGQWLTPRQPLLPVPYALGLRPGARVAGNGTDPVLSVSNGGTSGTAVKAQANILGVDALGQTAVRAVGQGVGVEAHGMTGVLAEGDVGVSATGLIGVRATSELGRAVEGTSGGSDGVFGESTGGYGVQGLSHTTYGVFGQSSGGFGAGVAGSGATGVYGQGALVGVSGYTTPEGATGVLGTATGNDGKGVNGVADGYGSVGVTGQAQFGTGVQGNGEIGVQGNGTVNAGVIGTGVVGVSGSSTTGDGVIGHTGGTDATAGVRGTATGLGSGGRFESTAGIGVFASGFEGIHAVSSGGFGVHGDAQASSGVRGDGKVGVEGDGRDSGVVGLSGSGVGVRAIGSGTWADNAALRADNTNPSQGLAAYFTNHSDFANTHLYNSGSGEILILQSSGGRFLSAMAAGWETKFRLEYNGNAYADGSWNSGGADLAEMLPAVAGLTPGDVLAIGPDGRLQRAAGRYASNVAGVYSTQPGFVGGQPADGAAPGTVPLAIVGVVPVRASAENGAILPGALLAVADLAGHAMRAGANPPQGTVIGKALEPLKVGTGVIRMLVSLQ